MSLTVFISGQKYFGKMILAKCLELGVDVVGVCCPLDDKYIGYLAKINNIPIVAAGSLCSDTMPPGVDLGITAHSFDYIGRATRYKARLGWIGYHPSLLPRHRGRSSIEWAIRMGDPVTGGTVYWLNSGIDRGDILSQDWCFIDPALRSLGNAEAAKKLWRGELFEIGVTLLGDAVRSIAGGVIVKSPQDERFSTWEPSTKAGEIYKPDLLMLDEYNK